METEKLTVKIPAQLMRDIRVQAASRGVNIADLVREHLEATVPRQDVREHRRKTA
jgi:hypothetical protein